VFDSSFHSFHMDALRFRQGKKSIMQSGSNATRDRKKPQKEEVNKKLESRFSAPQKTTSFAMDMEMETNVGCLAFSKQQTH
jgi:hypothetical protein